MSVAHIGIFDSGVGGLSVLVAVRKALPHAVLHGVADSGHAPYGERSDDYVLDRCERIAAHLLSAGAQTLVIACNTATALAAEALRSRWPHIPIVGIEPGLKPGLIASRRGRIGVMATAATLRSPRFKNLVRVHGGGAVVFARACTGLAAAIESGRLDSPALAALVEQHCAPMRDAEVDVVVLGCTHYAFARHLIQAAMGPRVTIIDTAEAVARRVASVCGRMDSSGEREHAGGETLLQTSGDVASLRRIARRWLDLDVVVLPLGVAGHFVSSTSTGAPNRRP